MSRRTPVLALVALAFATAIPAAAAGSVPDAAAAAALRDEVSAAVASGDVERVAALFTDNAVVTLQNADVARGRDGIRAYWIGMTRGKGALVQTYDTAVTIDGDPIAAGEGAAVLAGSSRDHFLMSSGAEMTLESRWTATVVRDGDAWRIAGLHVSSNLYSNPILYKMRTTAYIAGAFGFVMGIVIGAAGFIVGRSRPHTTE